MRFLEKRRSDNNSSAAKFGARAELLEERDERNFRCTIGRGKRWKREGAPKSDDSPQQAEKLVSEGTTTVQGIEVISRIRFR